MTVAYNTIHSETIRETNLKLLLCHISVKIMLENELFPKDYRPGKTNTGIRATRATTIDINLHTHLPVDMVMNEIF